MRAEMRRFLAVRCDRDALRAVVDAPEKIDRHLWREIADLGVLGLAIPEGWGGAGAGEVDQCAIAEELGRGLAPVPVASSIYLAAGFLLAAGTDAQKSRYLPELAVGNLIGTFAFAEGVGPLDPRSIGATVERGRLRGVKLPVADGGIADFAVVAARESVQDGGASIGLFVVDLTGPGVDRKAIDTIDLLQGHARIEFAGAEVEPLGCNVDGWPVIQQVLDRAAVLMAFEQTGGADRTLEMGRDHALERRAFGRPIGSFQAIKHMLADMYVAATLARSNAYYGAWALASASGALRQAAATARVSATQAFLQCARDCIQVHGGMGFTWDLDCHLYYRRANLQGVALGGMAYWERRLIDALVANAASSGGGARA
jgi:alkylation response protein AidB-like acyl-CoA dehydrogenase